MRTRAWRLGVIAICCICAIGCFDRGGKDAPVPVSDSPEARHLYAVNVVRAYTMDEWRGDIEGQLAAVVGEELSEEVRRRVRDRLDEQELLERRISFLTKIFTAPELAELAEIYSDPVGKAAMRKLRRHDDLVRDALTPVLTEVLSNSEAPAKAR